MSAQVTGMLLGAVGTAILSFAGAVVAWRKLGPENRNTDANTARTIVETAGAVVERLEAEVARLSDTQDRLLLKVQALEQHVGDLETVMREAGLTPPPRPNFNRRRTDP